MKAKKEIVQMRRRVALRDILRNCISLESLAPAQIHSAAIISAEEIKGACVVYRHIHSHIHKYTIRTVYRILSHVALPEESSAE
jgi:hypothetical protein